MENQEPGINAILTAAGTGHQDTSDPSQDLLIYLALAYNAARRLTSLAGEQKLGNQVLLFPSIQRAFREASHIRKTLNFDWVDFSLISRMGRVWRKQK